MTAKPILIGTWSARVGNPLLREERLPASVTPESSAAAQILAHPSGRSRRRWSWRMPGGSHSTTHWVPLDPHARGTRQAQPSRSGWPQQLRSEHQPRRFPSCPVCSPPACRGIPEHSPHQKTPCDEISSRAHAGLRAENVDQGRPGRPGKVIFSWLTNATLGPRSRGTSSCSTPTCTGPRSSRRHGHSSSRPRQLAPSGVPRHGTSIRETRRGSAASWGSDLAPRDARTSRSTCRPDSSGALRRGRSIRA